MALAMTYALVVQFALTPRVSSARQSICRWRWVIFESANAELAAPPERFYLPGSDRRP
jgi:hypothetical protein